MTHKHPGRRSSASHLPAAVVAGLAGILLSAGAASAQDQPTTGAATEPRTQSPFWEGDRYDDRSRDGRYDDDQYDDDDSFRENFPVDLAQQVPLARERYVALKWSYKTARDRLGDRVDALRRSLEDSEEYRSLVSERNELEAAIRRSRQEALEPLQDDPQYQALLDLQADLEGQIRAEHRSPDRDMDRIRGMSELAMNYARQRREMETGLTGTDTSIQTSQDRLRELYHRERELEEELDRNVRNDEELAGLREQIQQLRVAYLAAGAYYDSTVRAADIAADFAYYNALARAGYGSGGYDPYAGYGSRYSGYGFGGQHFGGVVVAGLPGVFPPGDGPIRLRSVIYPTPILSNTHRGVDNVFIPNPGAPGGSPPDIPPPDDD